MSQNLISQSLISQKLRTNPLEAVDLSSANNAQIQLQDLTSFARIGFKGVDTPAWLASQNIALADKPNEAHQEASLINARLSSNEFLLIELDGSMNSTIDTLRSNWSMDLEERTYLLERADSHCCISVAGESADQLFSKICGVDLRPRKFNNLSVAQTSVAKLNGIVVRADLDQGLRYLLLVDISAAEYLSMVLLDAAAEFTN